MDVIRRTPRDELVVVLRRVSHAPEKIRPELALYHLGRFLCRLDERIANERLDAPPMGLLHRLQGMPGRTPSAEEHARLSALAAVEVLKTTFGHSLAEARRAVAAASGFTPGNLKEWTRPWNERFLQRWLTDDREKRLPFCVRRLLAAASSAESGRAPVEIILFLVAEDCAVARSTAEGQKVREAQSRKALLEMDAAADEVDPLTEAVVEALRRDRRAEWQAFEALDSVCKILVHGDERMAGEALLAPVRSILYGLYDKKTACTTRKRWAQEPKKSTPASPHWPPSVSCTRTMALGKTPAVLWLK